MPLSVPSCLKGFTLIEIMIVVAIVGILSVIAVPAYNSYINTAKMSKVTKHLDMAIAYDTTIDFPRDIATLITTVMGAAGASL